MKKKLITILLCGCMLVTVLGGCGESPQEANTPAENGSQEEAPQEPAEEGGNEAGEDKTEDYAEEVLPVMPGNTSVEIVSASVEGNVYEDTLTVTEGGEEGTEPTVLYETTYFAYVPSGEGYGDRSTASPVLIVYGNEAFTSETVMETAMKSGLAEIADHEHAPVIFVNPSQESWNEADTASYLGVKNMFADGHSAEDTFTEGKNTETGSYPGTCTRMYVFAEGAGADFVYENLAQGVYGSGQYMGNAIWKPVGLFLLNPSSENKVELDGLNADGYEYLENDQKREVPVVVVNGTEPVKEAFTALNSSENTLVTSDEAKDLSEAKAVLLEGYDAVMEHHLTRDAGFGISLLELPAASSIGLTESRETFQSSTGKSIDYFLYLPEGCEQAEASSIPLLLGFHGGGNSAEMYAWSAGWPQIAGENNFIFVSVDLHVDYVEEIVELKDALTEQFACIDTSRIYAAGFSMGSIKSSTLGFTYDDVFAAINPTNAISFIDAAHGNVVPVFYNAGENSHFNLPFMMEGKSAEIPTTNLNGREAFAKLLVSNGVIADAAQYEFDENADAMFGIAGTETNAVESKECSNVTETIRRYNSIDGNCYTVMSTTSNAIHEPLRVVSENAWEFMSQFSRNGDGTVAINGEGSYNGK